MPGSVIKIVLIKGVVKEFKTLQAEFTNFYLFSVNPTNLKTKLLCSPLKLPGCKFSHFFTLVLELIEVEIIAKAKFEQESFFS